MNAIIFIIALALMLILLAISFKFAPFSIIAFIIGLLFLVPLATEPSPSLSYDVVGCTQQQCSTTTLSYSVPREMPIILLIVLGAMPMILFLRRGL